MRKLLALLLTLSMLALTGCPSSGPTLPPATAGGGFFISTFTSFNLSPPVVAPLVQIKMTWKKDLPGAVGNTATQNVTTNAAGVGIASNARVPATWNFKWVFALVGPCEGQNLDADAKEVDDDIGLVCTVETIGGADQATASVLPDFSFSPNPIATDGSSGSEAFISGSNFSAQFGMPLVQYFDLNGNLITQSNADAVAPNGTWMSAPVPDISQLPVGTYVGLLNNANPNGGYDIIGSVTVQVVPPPPPPPPPDPCPDGRCINQCKKGILPVVRTWRVAV
jgi:hypothetical protein